MAVITVTEKNFATVTSKGIVLLDFWAGWCSPCRGFAPVFEAAARRHLDVTFGKIDVDAQPGLSQAFQISSIPTLLIMRDGVLLAAQPGAMPASKIDALIVKVQGLDMAEVLRNVKPELAVSHPRAAAGGR
ncbi:MAG: thioredoxin fold domain-containing protein [Kofleriaceae bacterium]|nr:thioredoxin fold domain-containing protein [Kofleriaceae bacterium]